MQGGLYGARADAALLEQTSPQRDLAPTPPDSAQRQYQAILEGVSNPANVSGMVGRANGLTLNQAAGNATDEVIAAAMARQAAEREAETRPLLFTNTLENGGGNGISSDRQTQLANARNGGANLNWTGTVADVNQQQKAVAVTKSRVVENKIKQVNAENGVGDFSSYIRAKAAEMAWWTNAQNVNTPGVLLIDPSTGLESLSYTAQYRLEHKSLKSVNKPLGGFYADCSFAKHELRADNGHFQRLPSQWENNRREAYDTWHYM